MIISIVTINLNNSEGLRKTIESVINQTRFDIIEYIIIDGGSTDGSVDIIKEYQDKISHWVSEKDEGIYNAMNKGIDYITGDYALFLNSGDYLFTHQVIEQVIDKLDKDIVYGDEYKVKGTAMNLSKYPNTLTEHFFKTTALPHQSTFIKSELLKKNKYSEEYKLLGDWLWFRERVMDDNISYKHITDRISCYGLDGVSTIQRSVHEREKREYYKKIGK